MLAILQTQYGKLKVFLVRIQGIWFEKAHCLQIHDNLPSTETNFCSYQLTLRSYSQNTYIFFWFFFNTYHRCNPFYNIFFFRSRLLTFRGKNGYFSAKIHFWGLNSIVFEIRQPYLSLNGQNWSIIVWPNCSHWKVDDFRFLKLPKMLSWLRDMPILSK